MLFLQEENWSPWAVRVQFEDGEEIGVYEALGDFRFLTEGGVRTVRAHVPMREIPWLEAVQRNPFLFAYLEKCHWFGSSPPQGCVAPRRSRFACHLCGQAFLAGDRTCRICCTPVRESLPPTIAGRPAPEEAP